MRKSLRGDRKPYHDLTESPRWLDATRPAFFFCIFLACLLLFFFLIIFIFVPVLHTDVYIDVGDPIGILDDDHHHHHDDDHHHFVARQSPVEGGPGLREVAFAGERKEWVLRMPYPRGVDDEIMDRAQDQCGNFSLFACGKWRGMTMADGSKWSERSFGSAARDSLNRLDMVLQLEAAQFSSGDVGTKRDERSGGSGAFADMTYSCINTALYPQEESDLDYARATLLKFSPPDGTDGKSQTYLGAYALGVAIVYGDQPGMVALMSMNPSNTRETLLEFGPSTQIMSMLMLDNRQIDAMVDAGCRTLMAVELFPWSMWPTQAQCLTDFRGIISSLISQTAQADRTAPTMNTDYIFHHMEEDIYSASQWIDLVGVDFARGVEEGMLAAMHTFDPVLADEGLEVPDIAQLRKWTRYAPLIQWISSTTAQPHWVHFVRAMFVMGNYQYEESLLRDDRLGGLRGISGLLSPPGWNNLNPHFTGHPHIHSAALKKGVSGAAWRISRADKTPAPHPNNVARREERNEARQALLGDDPLAVSALIRSDLWRRCAWLSREYMHAEVDNSVARSAVSLDARERVHQVTEWVVEAMAEDIEQSAKLSAKSKEAILDKLRAIKARVSVPWDVRGRDSTPPLSVPYDVDREASFTRNIRQARARNVIQGMIEGVRSHGRSPEERPSLSHTFEMPTSAVNAYYDPTSNQIFFLAGILAPPFFSLKYDDATQLATLGAIIGHEVAHAFDATGKMFKKDGSLGQALPADIERRYAEAEACFVEQYSNAPTPNGNRVDGQQTLGENMADVMGLRAAYRALWNLHKDRGEVPPAVRKEFVEAYAQMWCSAADKKTEAERAEFDVHAPGPARIHGALRNLVDPEGKHVMEQVYGCAVPAAMRPEAVCSVW